MIRVQTADLKSIVSRISLGALCPSVRVLAIDSATVEGVSIERPGIVIVIEAQDADTCTATTLCHTFPEPAGGFGSETLAAKWIFEKVRSVLVHELQEFFRFDGNKLQPPAHPIAS